MRRWGVVLVIVAVATGALAPSARVSPSQEPQPGGTLRIGVLEPFGFTDAFDPTGEYHSLAWGIYTNLLLRTLVTYEHVEGAEGAEVVPDLATELPEPTDEGKTYTFELKEGVRFGPPLDRPITSHDVEYAFERIGTAELAAQYRFYYDPLIVGMHDFVRKRSDDIAGIETPDERTIVFHLTRPSGDFLNRLSMPATAPIPEEVARCAKHAGAYGRLVIASGPYMLEGSQDLVVDRGCRAMDPISGFQPDERIELVRNPSYDPATDSAEVRAGYVDGVRFQIFADEQDIFRRIERGRLESSTVSVPSRVVDRYRSHPELDATLRSSPLDRTWYLSMNLTQAPFDDIHVRKAVNLAMDKAAMQSEWGGEIAADVATHILPPNTTGGHPNASEYDPYPSRDHGGDLIAAREEMKQSEYDDDHDGRCDARACRRVLTFTRDYSPWRELDETVADSLRPLGITLAVKERINFYQPVQTVSRNIPFALGAGWAKDYPDAQTYMPWLFGSQRLLCYGNVNYSLVGATRKTKRECGAKGSFRNLPNVDRRIRACRPLRGSERTQCWIDLDKHLMENVVPWVPYLWERAVRLVGPSVTKYEHDQFSGSPAYSHMAVDPSRQRD